MKKLIGLWLLATPAFFYGADREDSPRSIVLLEHDGDVIMDYELFTFKHAELGVRSIPLHRRMKNSDLTQVVATAFELDKSAFYVRSSYSGQNIPDDANLIAFKRFLEKHETPFTVARR